MNLGFEWKDFRLNKIFFANIQQVCGNIANISAFFAGNV